MTLFSFLGGIKILTLFLLTCGPLLQSEAFKCYKCEYDSTDVNHPLTCDLAKGTKTCKEGTNGCVTFHRRVHKDNQVIAQGYATCLIGQTLDCLGALNVTVYNSNDQCPRDKINTVTALKQYDIVTNCIREPPNFVDLSDIGSQQDIEIWVCSCGGDLCNGYAAIPGGPGGKPGKGGANNNRALFGATFTALLAMYVATGRGIRMN